MRWPLTVTLLCVGIAGCESSRFIPDQTSSTQPDESSTPVKIGAVELKIGDGQAMRDMIAAHKGQVVFVDYWATWCQPCVEAFPHTVELHQRFKDQGLATIAVSFDELRDKEKVAKFLSDQGANFENLLSSYDGVGTKAAEDFEVALLPTFLLYDKQGKLRHKWEEKTVEIDQKIEELLAE